ncbi:AAA family ATPase [Psychromonas sp. SP041]|uniref:SF1B family DNA helicase RecD2 n=1 Tax=Psychromonas sp. SP041 TaxID=1365007 RepID=UPI0010C7B00E|nr:AAA family ATPase [Psychromonas sp. SP041]
MANISLNGIVTKIHSTNKDRGFCIVTIKGDDDRSKEIIKSEKNGKDTVTLLGTYFNPKVGEQLTCEGYFKSHKTFGKQYSAQQILSTVSLSQSFPKEIIHSDMLKPIEENLRLKIYKKYGDNSLKLLMTQSPLLTEDGFITKKRFAELKKEMARLKITTKTYNYLRAVGLPEKLAHNVMEARGGLSKTYVTVEPYSLLDVPGMGFKSLDTVASEIGMSFTSKARLDYCFDHILTNHFEQGHTGFPIDKLAYISASELSVGPTEVKEYLKGKIESGEYTYNHKERFFTTYKIHEIEKAIAKHLFRLQSTPFKKARKINNVQESFLKEGQVTAIKNTLMNKVSIITGGPGVGKTTVVKYVIDNIKQSEGNNHKFVLAAPTGKASTRMSQSTNLPADTVHSLLDYNPKDGFRKGQFDALKADTVIIDETTMVDLNTFYSLLESIPSSCRLVMVGDIDQLPSVGSGAVLRDIIDSKQIITSELTEPVRFGSESQIVTNAQRVNAGQAPIFSGNDNSDFIWIDADNDEDIKKKIKALASIIPAKFNIPVEDIQVLSPQKETECGVNSLNKTLDEIMNPKEGSNKFEVKSFGKSFRVGDRVMQIRNNKKLNVSNGDVGTINSFNMKLQTVRIKFDENTKDLPIKNLGHMRSANAITIHKSQGSEYSAVIMPISKSSTRMLTKQLVYTGMTRAKKLLVMIGDKDALKSAIENTRKQNRVTGLRGAINEVFNEKSLSLSKSINQEEPEMKIG